jgi:hypothetical protein
MVTVEVTFPRVEVFPLKCVTVTPEAIEVFTNIPCPMGIVEGSECCPLHVPQLYPRESPLVLVVDASVHMSVSLEFADSVHREQIACNWDEDVIKVSLLEVEL